MENLEMNVIETSICNSTYEVTDKKSKTIFWQDEKTAIQFASWGSKSEIEILKPILAEFGRQNPDINIDFVHIPQNYFQKIHIFHHVNIFIKFKTTHF